MPTTRHCVLIVDDEPDVCDSVHDLLRREFRVLKAHSAEEGYRLMQEEEVHIVMSDQRMPQITGIELLTKLKARHPHAIRMRPMRPDAAIDELPRHDAEAPRIEVAQIDDIDAHDIILTRGALKPRSEYCVAQ